MSDELLHAIREQPDDDAPRLVYADWLEERGELDRATLIREQCALESVPKPHPLWVAHWLWTRGHQHAAPLPPLPAGVTWHPFAYRRGFPERVYVEDPEALHAIDLATPLRVLEVDARSPSFPLDRLLAWSGLAHVTRLEFKLGRFDARHVHALDASPKLVAVDTLGFAYEGITGDGLHALLRSRLVQQLVRLDLNDNFFLHHGRPLAESFRDAPALPQLRRLRLARNRLDAEILAAIVSRPEHVAHLNVASNPIGDAGWSTIAACAWPLEHLELGSTGPRLAGVRALVASSLPATLRTLGLRGNRLGPQAGKLLASVTWHELEQLDTYGLQLGELPPARFPKLRR
jgi:uncharacterized protein (TIGR02996 family)